ncbi:SOS-induced cell division inhibitor SulA [Klebsiella pneumoniae]|uniref:SOS-induced cell division inhibitor SulA n=1 Tax=Klebsiella pneumoniae TaxID=573 RepID=UPI00396F58F8
MFTSAHANRSAQASAPAGHYAHRSGEQNTNGLISEIVYREDQPMMTQLLLLPLLQQLGQQSRWQLWLTPQQKLSREWVQSAGLPLSKVMQISQLSPSHTIDSMIRALRTGNYSVVICWLAEELTADEPRQPGGCKLKTAPVRPVVAARPAEYVCSEDLFY